jgi:hypothetical protein
MNLHQEKANKVFEKHLRMTFSDFHSGSSSMYGGVVCHLCCWLRLCQCLSNIVTPPPVTALPPRAMLSSSANEKYIHHDLIYYFNMSLGYVMLLFMSVTFGSTNMIFLNKIWATKEKTSNSFFKLGSLANLHQQQSTLEKT